LNKETQSRKKNKEFEFKEWFGTKKEMEKQKFV
jgi:hypothetical protein